jgi:glutamyl-tRNA synthetase
LPPDEGQRALFVQAMPLVKERASFLSEIPAKLGYLFSEPPVPPPEEFVPKKSNLKEAARLLKTGREMVAALAESRDAAAYSAAAELMAKETAEKEGVKLGDLLTPLRVAVTGSRVSPPLFDSLRLLGRERCLERIDRALLALSER